ncbi:oligoendopeptidase, pepF/M3 family [Atopostipes suicloacalis DSM 15692]|uniref:Oligoendopeptidase, pepF/M3 family n=1 Tax=Atopostipes suicloacalis DSM 15692 TaxID=1121025 RepID=A0A1M4TSV9_9LACT|nr:M3 family oligoendopeptidase [Atopostipes suicloacalis]SHE47496.1 oligoendopeptidase, pepF/M3 family [Atopostipes suicloacalis DSM 15692]
MNYKNTWDMESVFAGGSDSPAFHEKISNLQEKLKKFDRLVNDWNSQEDAPDYKQLEIILSERETLEKGIGETRTFISGLSSADVNDTAARTNLNIVTQLSTKLSNSLVVFQKKITDISDEAFKHLLEQKTFKQSAFPLNEIREQAQKLLSTEEEELLNNLSVDGFQGWGTMYNELVAAIEVPFEEAGEITSYSAGQAENKMNAEKDSKKRSEMLESWENAWAEKADLFANTLNHLAGFRLSKYEAHEILDYMEPPLEYNRMESDTLNAMWDTISANKGKIVDYFERKAKLLDLKKLSWLDVTAAVNVGDFEEKEYTFTEAADFIMENFESFSPKMAQLAEQAFEEQWIEAEDRPGKRPGGYCANLPESKQSRIFMTFSGSSDNVSTLAHELGHAFHSSVLRDLPILNQKYAMNVAETASTFAELIVSDATIENANSEAEKISLLDEKISRSATMMMNIHARYLFERIFHEERQKGIVSAKRLSELMLDAQKEAYKDALETYHPMFWAAKLHFYNTGVPFYNFPYTFGYFFSLGIYARALETDGSFEEEYIALLRDTASMSTEDLAQKHLQVDLRKSDFWQEAIDRTHEDIDEFLELTEKYV